MLVNLGKQLQRVYAVYHVDERRNVLYLVALQVAGEVPSDVFGQYLLLDGKVLGLVLAKVELACTVGLFDGLCRVVFRNCNQAHTLGDGCAYCLEPFCYAAHYGRCLLLLDCFVLENVDNGAVVDRCQLVVHYRSLHVYVEACDCIGYAFGLHKHEYGSLLLLGA